MKQIRKLVYGLGFRPKPGSVFYSPSLAYLHEFHEVIKKFLHGR